MTRLASKEKRLKKILIELKTEDIDAKNVVLQELIEFMQPRLYSEALRFLRDEHEAEATVNYVFAKLFFKAIQFNEERAAMPYVISVLRNMCRDILKMKFNKFKPSENVIDHIGNDAVKKHSLYEGGFNFNLDNFSLATQFNIEDMLSGNYKGSISGLYRQAKKELTEL